jgi:hypothetical protein
MNGELFPCHPENKADAQQYRDRKNLFHDPLLEAARSPAASNPTTRILPSLQGEIQWGLDQEDLPHALDAEIEYPCPDAVPVILTRRTGWMGVMASR